MTLSYQDIQTKFLSKMTDYSFLQENSDFIQESMKDWLHSAASHPYTRFKFLKLSLDDELMEIEFILKNSLDDESDSYFVTEIFAKGMVIEWLEPQVKNSLYTHQFIGGKEEKFYSQSPMLSQLQKLLADEKNELRKIIRDYGQLNNSYIGGI